MNILIEPVVRQQLVNSLLVGEFLDGANCCQLLLQGDDFEGQVTGRQEQDAHAGENSRELQQHSDCVPESGWKWSMLELSKAGVQSALLGLQ